MQAQNTGHFCLQCSDSSLMKKSNVTKGTEGQKSTSLTHLFSDTSLMKKSNVTKGTEGQNPTSLTPLFSDTSDEEKQRNERDGRSQPNFICC
ncbi:hypothetical protein AVEN_234873-1 [Araneus ventricosus]|uniref:Uncharacterized protein n=1 Tax=Araneus ventricosus TaxID=182803 RepID=A0A4Y2SQE8_ARAVE|nr:hypothetical protein AVEN_244090-1 [Araneus ventricosus]GBN90528.1 hypothetical protein AVEN_234873-1 [Araneus ventricosus]